MENHTSPYRKSYKKRNLVLIAFFLIIAIGAVIFLVLNKPGGKSLKGIINESMPALTLVINSESKDGPPTTQGSGFFINQNGDFITNYHVLAGALHSKIKLSDETEFQVEKVLFDNKKKDIVIASVSNDGQRQFESLSFSEESAEVGDSVLVIGSPLGLAQTVSEGIVSAIRDIPDFGKIIQITAPISPGSSGSPVLNMNGEVIGVASFQAREGQNLNFAIPFQPPSKFPKMNENLNAWAKGNISNDIKRGKILFSKKEYVKAIDYFKKVIRNNPSNSIANLMLGISSYYSKEYKSAYMYTKKSIQVNPSYEAYYFLSSICEKLGLQEEQKKALELAGSFGTGDAFSYWELGRIFFNEGNYDQSYSYLKKSIEIDPRNAEAFFLLGKVLNNQKYYADAIRVIEQGLSIRESAEAYHSLFISYGGLNNKFDAHEAIDKAVRLDPKNDFFHYKLALSYYLNGDRKNAYQVYLYLIRIQSEYSRDLSDLF